MSGYIHDAAELVLQPQPVTRLGMAFANFNEDHLTTLPKFNSSPLKSYLPNRKVVFQPPFFRGYVKLRGGNIFLTVSRGIPMANDAF